MGTRQTIHTRTTPLRYTPFGDGGFDVDVELTTKQLGFGYAVIGGIGAISAAITGVACNHNDPMTTTSKLVVGCIFLAFVGMLGAGIGSVAGSSSLTTIFGYLFYGSTVVACVLPLTNRGRRRL